MGNPDPTELINLETNRRSTMSPSVWNKTFRAWPHPLDGWRDWYLGVAKTHQAKWVTYALDQRIALSLSNIKKNELMLRSTSYFWSNAFNTFLFGHGPMIVTLANIHMLTGLRIIGLLWPYNLIGKPEHKVPSIRSGGGEATSLFTSTLETGMLTPRNTQLS
jgi:hypothetical protein